jgi:hypothetical protein
MLAPENLVIKEIAGQKVKAKELLQYFKSYLEIYRGDKLPEPKSMLVVSVSCLLCFSLMFICCSDFNILYIVYIYIYVCVCVHIRAHMCIYIVTT